MFAGRKLFHCIVLIAAASFCFFSGCVPELPTFHIITIHLQKTDLSPINKLDTTIVNDPINVVFYLTIPGKINKLRLHNSLDTGNASCLDTIDTIFTQSVIEDKMTVTVSFKSPGLKRLIAEAYWDDDMQTATDSITIFERLYGVKPTTYTVTFDGQGATTAASPSTKTVTAGGTVGALPTPPIKTGYTFKGWFTAVNGGGTEFTSGTTVTANDTVYAKWNPNGMVWIPAKDSTFNMGELGYDEPVHLVKFSADYWMDATEVTQGSYDTLMGKYYSLYKKPSWDFGSGDKYPAYYVSWFDAVLYCNARTKATGSSDTVYSYMGIMGTLGNGCSGLAGLNIDLSKGGFRLPTEAQWEYACRGGTTTSFYWGKNYDPYSSSIIPYPKSIADSNEVDSYAIWWRNSNNKGSGSPDYGTHPVATKKPNGFGLYDMSGNVCEWCNDWYGSYSGELQTDPTGPLGKSQRVLRGGGWDTDADAFNLRSAYRNSNEPDHTFGNIGFRVCLPAQ
jgi:uncharacterized repeat protein (TIGR02543 family)